MDALIEFLRQPWPWWIGGPMIGLFVPALLLLTNRAFGISSSLRHMVAACFPRSTLEYFKYDWKQAGGWNLFFVGGVIFGGFVAGILLAGPGVDLAAATRADLTALGIRDFSGLMPDDLYSLEGLLSWQGMILLVLGGFFVGFGARYADGCTSGHGVFGLANFQLSSLVAVGGFFVGGLVMTHLILPLLLRL
jgi:uncharacterized membrane protein YedE/YeeE